MLTETFISRYCEPTSEFRDGRTGPYRVYLVSPAAIMSVMPSSDSRDTDLPDLGWDWTLNDKRTDNDFDLSRQDGPLTFLAKEGFTMPLCILTFGDEVYKFHNGNHRLAAAIDLGYQKVPVIFLEYHDETSYDRDSRLHDDRWVLTEVRYRKGLSVLVPPPNAEQAA